LYAIGYLIIDFLYPTKTTSMKSFRRLYVACTSCLLVFLRWMRLNVYYIVIYLFMNISRRIVR